MKIKYISSASKFLSLGTMVLGLHRMLNTVIKFIYTYYL